MAVFEREKFFCGHIAFGDRLYMYEVSESNCGPKKYEFTVDWRLKVLLQHNLEKFLLNCKFNNPHDFHAQITNLVETHLPFKSKQTLFYHKPLKMFSFLKNLKQELKTCEDFIKSVDLETGLVEIEVLDAQLRAHKVIFKLSQNYPREPIEIVSHNLPLHSINLPQNETDLNNLYSIPKLCNKFSQLVELFQEFWNVMLVVDSGCIVLDPPNPTYKDIVRRVKLSDTLSIALTFNPYSPKQRPIVKLLGCQSDVNKYEAVMLKHLEEEMWDVDEDVTYNLSNLLEVNICKKVSNDECVGSRGKERSEEECAICFMWRLGDEIPNEICERATCKSMYHSSCLFTYLTSIPKNRNFFGRIQGECPNCDEVISCTALKYK